MTRPPVVVPEFETLVIPLGSVWESLGRTRGVFERDVLPQYLARARWFPERVPQAIKTKLLVAIPCASGEVLSRSWIALCEARGRGDTARYILPLRINWARYDRSRFNPQALAALRQGAREGTLIDVAADKDFISLLLENMLAGVSTESQGARLDFHATQRLRERGILPIETVRAVQTEQSNSTALVDTHYVVKIYRKLDDGINPEVEIGRFLTENAGFANTPALLGHVEARLGGHSGAVAIVHEFVENQGDAWTVTSHFLDRFIQEQTVLRPAEPTVSNEEQRLNYQIYMEHTGRRVAEMQMALASRDDIADFAPAPVTSADVQDWMEAVVVRAERVFSALRRQREKAADAQRRLIDAVLEIAPRFRDVLQGLLPEAGLPLKIRHHGDFHLGQMLIAKDDIIIIDFEGEPRRSLAERRQKAPAARDVAGLIRSIDYAATAALERAVNVERDAALATSALEKWRDKSNATFLAAYRQTMTDSRLWPADEGASRRLLDFFLLEKAFYEIEYELAHRPGWLRVPLAGTLHVLSRSRETFA